MLQTVVRVAGCFIHRFIKHLNGGWYALGFLDCSGRFDFIGLWWRQRWGREFADSGADGTTDSRAFFRTYRRTNSGADSRTHK